MAHKKSLTAIRSLAFHIPNCGHRFTYVKRNKTIWCPGCSNFYERLDERKYKIGGLYGEGADGKHVYVVNVGDYNETLRLSAISAKEIEQIFETLKEQYKAGLFNGEGTDNIRMSLIGRRLQNGAKLLIRREYVEYGGNIFEYCNREYREPFVKKEEVIGDC